MNLLMRIIAALITMKCNFLFACQYIPLPEMFLMSMTACYCGQLLCILMVLTPKKCSMNNCQLLLNRWLQKYNTRPGAWKSYKQLVLVSGTHTFYLKMIVLPPHIQFRCWAKGLERTILLWGYSPLNKLYNSSHEIFF